MSVDHVVFYQDVIRGFIIGVSATVTKHEGTGGVLRKVVLQVVEVVPIALAYLANEFHV